MHTKKKAVDVFLTLLLQNMKSNSKINSDFQQHCLTAVIDISLPIPRPLVLQYDDAIVMLNHES